MNFTVEIPRFGFGRNHPIEIQREDHIRTRIVEGNDTSLLPVPGLLAVERVRYPGGEHEAKIMRPQPIDHSLANIVNVVASAYDLVQDVDGTVYLERSPFCNDGIWQKGSRFWVTGEWDPEMNPPVGAIAAPPETLRRPLLTGGPETATEPGARAARRTGVPAADAEAAP